MPNNCSTYPYTPTIFSPQIEHELELYLRAFEFLDTYKPWMVNRWITRNDKWGYLPNIRAMNVYEYAGSYPGIKPEFYREICIRREVPKESSDNLLSSFAF